MKLLTVFALLCAMMALTTAAGECCAGNNFPSCPSGWTEYCNPWLGLMLRCDPKGCVVSLATRLSVGPLLKNCQSMKANLASVCSLEEYQLILMVVFGISKANERAWIGGTDGQQVNYWFWIDGTPFTYTNWCTGEPNNAGGKEECMEIIFAGQNCMNDQSCSYKSPSICVGRF